MDTMRACPSTGTNHDAFCRTQCARLPERQTIRTPSRGGGGNCGGHRAQPTLRIQFSYRRIRGKSVMTTTSRARTGHASHDGTRPVAPLADEKEAIFYWLGFFSRELVERGKQRQKVAIKLPLRCKSQRCPRT